MPLLTVTVDGAASRIVQVSCRHITRDDFTETDHPRAANGQFGSGGPVQIVTTTDAAGGVDVRHVGEDQDEASDVRDAIEDDEGDDTAEHHAVGLERHGDGPVDAVHIVHAGDGSGGVDIHGVHDGGDFARGQAVALSRDAWDENGPDRSEVDADPIETTEAAEAWNEHHAADHDDVKVVIDPATDEVATDEDGEPQFEQGGEAVDATLTQRQAFADLMEEMHPQDERAAYPGFDAANEHFEAEGRHEAVFRVHSHEIA